LVLDTNVVLDWLVFRDPRCDALARGLLRTQLRWLATEAMRKELEHVLTRGTLDAWKPDRAAVLARWDRWATQVEPLASAQSTAMRCTDPDDQKFIDLALQVGATALLSRDRAVLALARRARAVGLDILSTADWALRTQP
jgi:predicted nucleic acid-binding protein